MSDIVVDTDVASAILKGQLPDALIQAHARLRGRLRPVNDSWIAACCLVRELPLATFNIKDYADFAEHEGLELVH